MNYEKIFPSVIGYDYDKEFTDKVLPVAKEYLGDATKLTYRWGYKNTHGTIINDSKVNFIYDKIVQISNTYIKDQGFDKPKELELQLFFSEIYADDFHEKHSHPGSFLSGLFYLDVPDDAAPIIFYDPSVHYDYIPFTPDELERKTYIIKPKSGMLLVWNSWIKHEVPKASNIQPRITAVFDVIKK